MVKLVFCCRRKEGMSLEVGRKLLEDEAKFLDLPRCSVFMTEEKEIF